MAALKKQVEIESKYLALAFGAFFKDFAVVVVDVVTAVAAIAVAVAAKDLVKAFTFSAVGVVVKLSLLLLSLLSSLPSLLILTLSLPLLPVSFF